MADPASHHRAVARLGVALLAPLVAVVAWAPAAAAAPAVTVVLDSSDGLGVDVRPIDNLGPLDVTSVDTGPVTPVDAGWSGSATVQLPTVIDGVPTQAQLYLYPTMDSETPTRIYDSESTVPADQLTVTGLGSNRFEVDLPADDSVNGPYGKLLLKPLTSTTGPVGGSELSGMHWLDLSAGVPAVTLTPQTVLWAYQDATVAAGDTVEVTLPAGSVYSSFGFSSITPSTFVLLTADEHHSFAATSGTALAASYSADGRSASMAIPTGTAPGKYLLMVTLGNGVDPVVARTLVRTTVPTPAPAPPPSNDGLTSDTGWVEEAGPASSTGLAVLGGGLLVVAAGVAGGVLRAGRRSAPQE